MTKSTAFACLGALMLLGVHQATRTRMRLAPRNKTSEWRPLPAHGTHSRRGGRP